MADTTRWTLQQCADAAAKRTDPYPPEDEVALAPPDRRCLGCGADLAGRYTKGAKFPLIYCGRQCQTIAARRWRDGPDETATLGLARYSWGEW